MMLFAGIDVLSREPLQHPAPRRFVLGAHVIEISAETAKAGV